MTNSTFAAPANRLLLASLVALALTARPTGPARADGEADEAELHFQRGAESYRKGDYTDALQHFLASNRLSPNRNVQFNIARAFEQLNRFPEAYRYYVGALEGETDNSVKRDVEAAISRVAPRVAVMEVQTNPPGATLYLDRKDLGSVGTSPDRLGVQAGTYTVIAELPGYEVAKTERLRVSVGSRTPVKLSLTRIVGQVQVRGQEGLEVHVGDEGAPPQCTTPCDFDLPPGTHVLYFTSVEAVSVAPRQVQVVARKSVTVTASVEKLTGSVVVSADEPNALVEIDGKPMGFTPAVIPAVTVGKRKVRVSLRGYRAYETEVDVEYQKQVDLRNVRLDPLREVAAASRRTEQIEDAPASVTIITSQELRAFEYPTILEALRGVRGVALNYDSIYGNAAIRGLGQPNDYNNRLLVLNDGAVLNENILYQPFIHYDGRTDLGDIDRIEVVRGPGSVLYGTGAVSGVVNLVNRGRDEPDSIEAQVSSYDNSVARARGSFKQTLARDTGVWASVSAARSDGREAVLLFDADGDGREEANRIQAFDKFRSYSTSARAWHRALTVQGFATLRTVSIPTGSFGTIVNRDENQYDDGRALGEVRFEPVINDRLQVLARGYANYGYFHLDYLYEADEAGTAWEQPYFETYKGTWGGGEVRVVGQPIPPLRLTVGSEVTHHFQVEMKTGQNEFDGSETPILDLEAPYTVFAGYGLAEWQAHRKVLVSAGVRADRWDLSQDALSLESGMAVAEDFTSINPRAAIIVKPTSMDIVKLMGGRAFRAPSTYEYFYTDGGTTQVTSDCCGSTLAPETVYSAELEYTHRFNEDWSALGAGHALLAKRVIETVPVPDDLLAMNGWEEGTTYYGNSSVDQTVLGADVEVRREWRGGAFMSAQYGALNARYDDAPVMGGSTRVPNAPQHFFSFRGVVPVVPSLVTGAVRTTVEAPRRIDVESRDDTRTAVVTDLVVSGNVTRHEVRYAVGVYNLFNWQYELPASPYASRLMPQQGRSFMFSLTLVR
ncbi:MAG TPA: TonB-dependent receptor [Kofleriaceae bacterium]|nr:TonB-dependent receptor [Kofleriaceae bacterium]